MMRPPAASLIDDAIASGAPAHAHRRRLVHAVMRKSFGLMLEALDDLKAGEIYLYSGASPSYALWGELTSKAPRGKASDRVDGALPAPLPGLLACMARCTHGSRHGLFSTAAAAAQERRPRG